MLTYRNTQVCQCKYIFYKLCCRIIYLFFYICFKDKLEKESVTSRYTKDKYDIRIQERIKGKFTQGVEIEGTRGAGS